MIITNVNPLQHTLINELKSSGYYKPNNLYFDVQPTTIIWYNQKEWMTFDAKDVMLIIDNTCFLKNGQHFEINIEPLGKFYSFQETIKFFTEMIKFVNGINSFYITTNQTKKISDKIFEYSHNRGYIEYNKQNIPSSITLYNDDALLIKVLLEELGCKIDDCIMKDGKLSIQLQSEDSMPYQNKILYIWNYIRYNRYVLGTYDKVLNHIFTNIIDITFSHIN